MSKRPSWAPLGAIALMGLTIVASAAESATHGQGHGDAITIHAEVFANCLLGGGTLDFGALSTPGVYSARLLLPFVCTNRSKATIAPADDQVVLASVADPRQTLTVSLAEVKVQGSGVAAEAPLAAQLVTSGSDQAGVYRGTVNVTITPDGATGGAQTRRLDIQATIPTGT